MTLPRWPGSDRPLLLAIAHLPEHPLVAAGRREALGDARALAFAELGADAIGEPEDGAHDLGELLVAVGFDPAPVEGLGRAAGEQLLTHLPVDPVAGQERAER